MKKFNFLLLSALLLLLPSCAKKEPTSIIGYDKYSTLQMQVLCMKEFRIAPILPDTSYQFVNSNGLGAFYSKYKKELFAKGVVEWNKSFDCNRFTLYFAAMSQIEYFASGFGLSGNGESIGVGEVYYVDDIRGPHAINILIVNGGFQFFEPQTGKFKILNKKERDSITFIKF